MWIIYLLTLIIALAASWLLTCGMVFVILCCFGLAFTWPIGTGVWLILLLLGSIFRKK